MSASPEFFLLVEGKQEGPFSGDQINEMLRNGEIVAETLCSPAPEQGWETAALYFPWAAPRRKPAAGEVIYEMGRRSSHRGAISTAADVVGGIFLFVAVVVVAFIIGSEAGLVAVIVWIVCLGLGWMISEQKGQGVAVGLLWPFFLGPIGVLIVACLPNLVKQAEAREAEARQLKLIALQEEQIRELKALRASNEAASKKN